MNDLKASLRSFIEGPDRSKEAARRIESDILRSLLADHPQFEDLLEMLASYQPGGGEFLYNENQMIEAVKSVAALLEHK